MWSPSGSVWTNLTDNCSRVQLWANSAVGRLSSVYVRTANSGGGSPVKEAYAVARYPFIGVVLALLLASCSVSALASTPQQSATTNPHGPLSMRCENCHTTDGWTPIRVAPEFNHDQTHYPLRGGHEKVACTQCHAKLIFSDVGKNCADCHADIHLQKIRRRLRSMPCLARVVHVPAAGPQSSKSLSADRSARRGGMRGLSQIRCRRAIPRSAVLLRMSLHGVQTNDKSQSCGPEFSANVRFLPFTGHLAGS